MQTVIKAIDTVLLMKTNLLQFIMMQIKTAVITENSALQFIAATLLHRNLIMPQLLHRSLITLQLHLTANTTNASLMISIARKYITVSIKNVIQEKTNTANIINNILIWLNIFKNTGPKILCFFIWYFNCSKNNKSTVYFYCLHHSFELYQYFCVQAYEWEYLFSIN